MSEEQHKATLMGLGRHDIMEQHELRAALDDGVDPGTMAMMATILPERFRPVSSLDEEVSLSGTLPPRAVVEDALSKTLPPPSEDAMDEQRQLAFTPRYTSLPLLDLTKGDKGHAPHFELGEVLGEGGTGVVRKARQAALGRDVAIKTLRRQLS
ncbi:MAG: hypothetical protein AAFX99_24275, partial [Myxococcota bacterium]